MKQNKEFDLSLSADREKVCNVQCTAQHHAAIENTCSYMFYTRVHVFPITILLCTEQEKGASGRSKRG